MSKTITLQSYIQTSGKGIYISCHLEDGHSVQVKVSKRVAMDTMKKYLHHRFDDLDCIESEDGSGSVIAMIGSDGDLFLGR